VNEADEDELSLLADLDEAKSLRARSRQLPPRRSRWPASSPDPLRLLRRRKATKSRS